MADLKTDYKDDVLDTTQNTKRKYQMIDNGDGTVSFEDVTEYLQQGDSFGADDTNATNTKVNALQSDIDEINDNLSDIKSDLAEKGFTDLGSITYDGTTKTHNIDWSKYDFLLFNNKQYNNVFGSSVVTTSYFRITSPNSRVIMRALDYESNKVILEIYQNGEHSFISKGSGSDTILSVNVIGIKL